MLRVNSQPQLSRPAYSTESSRAPSPTRRESVPPPAQGHLQATPPASGWNTPAQGHFQATPPASGASTPAPLRQPTVYQDQFGTTYFQPTGAPYAQPPAAALSGQPSHSAAPSGQPYAGAPSGQPYAGAPSGQPYAGGPLPTQPPMAPPQSMGAQPTSYAPPQAGTFAPAGPQAAFGPASTPPWAPSAQGPAAPQSFGAPPPAAPYGGNATGTAAGLATTAGGIWGAFMAGIAQGKAQTMAQQQGHQRLPSYQHPQYSAAAYAQPQTANSAFAQGAFANPGAPSGPGAFAPPAGAPMPAAHAPGAREQPAAHPQPQQVGTSPTSPGAPHGATQAFAAAPQGAAQPFAAAPHGAAQTFADAPHGAAQPFAHPSQPAEFAQTRPGYGAQPGAFGAPPAQSAPQPQPFGAAFAPHAQGAYGAPLYAPQPLAPLTPQQAQHLQTVRGALLHHRGLIQAARKRTNWAGGAEAVDTLSGSLVTEAASAGVAHWSNQAIDQFQKSQTYVRDLLAWTHSQGLISKGELSSTTFKVPDWADLAAKLLLGVDLSLFSLGAQGFNAYNLSQANKQTKDLIREINVRLGWPQDAGIEKVAR